MNPERAGALLGELIDLAIEALGKENVNVDTVAAIRETLLGAAVGELPATIEIGGVKLPVRAVAVSLLQPLVSAGIDALLREIVPHRVVVHAVAGSTVDVVLHD